MDLELRANGDEILNLKETDAGKSKHFYDFEDSEDGSEDYKSDTSLGKRCAFFKFSTIFTIIVI